MKATQTTCPPARGDFVEESKRRRWKVACICTLLAALVILVFGQTVRHGFVNFDDPGYIYENPVVSKGLTMEGVAWAFTHSLGANWHPLTTISHMLDCQLYGSWAGGHHLTNTLLHAVAAVLLFLLLRAMTGNLWRCAFVAAVFAIHPLRVESVAWISERKDVLSGIFFMLTLWAYARYARVAEDESGTQEIRNQTRVGDRGLLPRAYVLPSWFPNFRNARLRYFAVLIFFALGLLSKAMLVTVPFVLLLLDYWPLGRLQDKSRFPRLLWEKLPLFALSALSCVATILAQKIAIQPWERFPISLRIGNALVVYAVYLGKLIYPARLAVLYPMSKNGWPAWQMIATILLLAALTAGAFLLRRKQPYLVTGWLWYLGMLVPVIGIFQVGVQAYADRYTYLPQIGLCLAGTWAVVDWAGEWRQRTVVLGGVAVIFLGFLLAAAYDQTACWQDSIALWTHTLGCTKGNSVAHNNLGNALYGKGRREEATAQFREAVQIDPAYATAHNNLGIALFQQGQTDRAIAHFREAVRINPAYADAYYNLGNAMMHQGRIEQAVAQYREALRIVPGDAESRNNLGNALLQQGRTEEAIAQYREALRINPKYVEAHVKLGTALLGVGRAEEAIAQTRQALELQPANASIQNNLAWMLATASRRSLRNGALALELATKASQASGGNDPFTLDTLAAAYAETGDFPNAVQTAQHALQLAVSQSNSDLANALRREIKLYEAGESYREGQ